MLGATPRCVASFMLCGVLGFVACSRTLTLTLYRELVVYIIYARTKQLSRSMDMAVLASG
jgi:hypothetical protein